MTAIPDPPIVDEKQTGPKSQLELLAEELNDKFALLRPKGKAAQRLIAMGLQTVARLHGAKVADKDSIVALYMLGSPPVKAALMRLLTPDKPPKGPRHQKPKR